VHRRGDFVLSDDARSAGPRPPGYANPEAPADEPKFGFQPAVFQRDAGRGTDCFDQLGLLAEPGVVDQRGDLLSVLLDERGPADVVRSWSDVGLPS
jgi:hypothetical protein